MKSKTGNMLMVALWSLAILVVFAVFMSAGTRNKITFIGRMKTRHDLRYIGEAGAEAAVSFLTNNGTDNDYDALTDPWSTDFFFFKNISVGSGAFTVGYDYYDASTGKNQRRYGIVDEERKINVNTAEYGIISKLFTLAAGFDKKKADDMAAAIIDWRDEDDFPLINGAESRYYKSLSSPYESKNCEFNIPEELMLVRDMTGEVYDKIKQYVTVYGAGHVNVNTTSEMVLRALGVPESLARKIVVFRRGVDGKEGTYDDNVFTSSSSIPAKLSQGISLTAEEVAILSNLVSEDKLGVSSSVFWIRGVGNIAEKTSLIEVICVFDRDKAASGEKAIKYWRERYYDGNLPDVV